MGFLKDVGPFYHLWGHSMITAPFIEADCLLHCRRRCRQVHGNAASYVGWTFVVKKEILVVYILLDFDMDSVFLRHSALN